jgi:hypothetical protein
MIMILIPPHPDHQPARLNKMLLDQKRRAPKYNETDIQHAVPHGLGVRSQDIAALVAAPADGVEAPEKEDPATRGGEGAVDVSADWAGMLARVPGELPAEVEEETAPETVVASTGNSELS